jgi:hypothetical protein
MFFSRSEASPDSASSYWILLSLEETTAARRSIARTALRSSEE